MSKDEYDNHNYAYPSDDDFKDPAWQFGAAIHSPVNWFWSSESNESAARILEEQVKDYWNSHEPNHPGANILGPYYMLVGFAIECLLKGIIVANGHKVIKNGRIKFIDGNNQHDLVKLAIKAEINLWEDEETMLKTLTENLEWAGRYPMAQHWSRQFKKIEAKENDTATIEDVTPPYSNHDIHIINRLHTRIKGILASKYLGHEVKLTTVR